MMKTDTYVVADASGSVVQRNHFYPFGLSFADNENPETQPYKFNGKELDLFHGLNWYDYLARGMDPAAGRFIAIDPLCEKYFALFFHTCSAQIIRLTILILTEWTGFALKIIVCNMILI